MRNPPSPPYLSPPLPGEKITWRGPLESLSGLPAGGLGRGSNISYQYHSIQFDVLVTLHSSTPLGSADPLVDALIAQCDTAEAQIKNAKFPARRLAGPRMSSNHEKPKRILDAKCF